MIRRFALTLVVTIAPCVASAQLPYLTAPRGTLRIELGGAFAPASREFADGTRRDLGDPITSAALTAASSPLVRDLEARLSPLLGGTAGPASLGAISADAMVQRGAGFIGLAAGLSDRITAYASIPIVSVRTEARIDADPSAATVGLNPALLGDQSSAQFLGQFDTALGQLGMRLDAGDYAGTPTLQSLAEQTLADGTALRGALDALLVAGGTASPILPVADSPDGTALLAQVAGLRDRFATDLGIGGFTAAPGLPAEPITSTGFGQLLAAEEGFDLAPFDQQPLVGLGDIEVGLVVALAGARSIERRSWFGVWVTGGVSLPTGTPPDPRYLRDTGTGDGQLDVAFGGVIEAGRGRMGLRASAAYRLQLEGEREARIGRRDEFLLPASRAAVLRWDPGDEVLFRVEPFIRLVDRLAITGALSWESRGDDRWSTVGEIVPPGTGQVDDMGIGSARTATRWGLGLSYAHDGTGRDGTRRMPVEAGLAIERIIQSGSGLVLAPATTRLWFRVYKRLW
jgi:hypothetical protein